MENHSSSIEIFAVLRHAGSNDAHQMRLVSAVHTSNPITQDQLQVGDFRVTRLCMRSPEASRQAEQLSPETLLSRSAEP